MPSGPQPRKASGTDRIRHLKPIDLVRVSLLSIVIAAAPINPTFALRTGAALAVLVFLLSLPVLRTAWVDGIALAYAVAVVVSNYWSIDPVATELSAINTMACVVIFVTTRMVARRRSEWLAFGAAMALGCLYVVYRIFTENALRGVSLMLDSTATRYGVENVNANYLAYSLVTGSAILILVAGHSSRRRAVILLSVCVVLYIGVIQSGTRGALVGIGLGAAWIGLNYAVRFTSSKPLKILLWGLLASSMFITLGALQSLLSGRVAASARETGDLNGRLTVWPLALDQWWDNFWLGQGAGTFPSTTSLHIAAHNFVLDIGTGVGVVGVTLFVLILQRSTWVETKDAAHRISLVGMYALANAPLLLSGFWIESPSFWIGMALLSRLGALATPKDGGRADHGASRARSDRTFHPARATGGVPR